MKVIVTYNTKLGQLKCKYIFETGDRHSFSTPDKKVVSSFQKDCFFTLPDSFIFKDLHKDRLALAILLSCYPFIGHHLNLSFKVSPLFAKTVLQNSGITLQSSPSVLPYSPSGSEKPGLCLSMGLDSMAGLLLMPENTVAIFLDRVMALNDRDPYRKDSVYHGLAHVAQRHTGDIFVVPTNLEYLRKSIGFMIDISVGIPAILLSNHANLSSIGYGYSIHHYEHYQDGKLVGHCTGDDTKFNYFGWNQIYRAAGLYLNMVTMGLTEIGTMKVVMNSQYKDISTGCMRGKIGKPCNTCKKCYRKLLLKNYLLTGDIKSNQVLYQKLSRHPYHTLFNITDLDTLKFAFGYMTRDYQGNDGFLREVKKGLHKYSNKFKYLDKWFSGAQNCIDPQTYQAIISNLDKYGIEVI